MRVLVLSQYFYPENFRINDLSIALRERGFEVTVLSGMPNYPGGKLFDNYSWWRNRHDQMGGVSILRVPLFLRRRSKGWQLAMNYISFAISASVIGSWFLRGNRFDLIFVYEPSPFTVGLPGMLIRKLKRAPMFLWVQDLWPESLSATGAVNSPSVLSLVGSMVKMIYRSCDLVLVQSRGFIEPAVAAGAIKNRLKYFPNWAEPIYRPLSLGPNSQERKELPVDGLVAMFAGNLGAAQSLDTILDAAEILKEEQIHLVFLGDGRRRSWMKEQIDLRGLVRVQLLGSRPVETMPAYFSLADVMVVTLRSDPIMTKTIPGKIQSYLACGCPVIGALDGEGANLILESGAGFAVNSCDARGLADSVMRMSKLDAAERKRMGNAAIAYYRKHFDREVLIDRLEELMKDSCGK